VSPLAHTVYVDDLIRSGFNNSPSALKFFMNKTNGAVIDVEADFNAMIYNINLTERAFAALRPPPCGEVAGSTPAPGAGEVMWV